MAVTVCHTIRALVAAPLPAADSLQRSASWDARGSAAATSVLRRMVRRVGGTLCEPGGLPRTGIHRVLVCRPNQRLGNSGLISPLIAEIEALYPGAEIDMPGSYAPECLYANRFSVPLLAAHGRSQPGSRLTPIYTQPFLGRRLSIWRAGDIVAQALQRSSARNPRRLTSSAYADKTYF